MRQITTVMVLMVSGLLALAAVQSAEADTYTFTKIVDNTVLDPLAFTAMNNSGTVATGAFNPATGHIDILTGSGGPLTTIAEVSSIAGSPAINNAGTVAFTTQTIAGDRYIVTGSGGGLTTVIDSSGTLFGFGQPRINDGGLVAFQASGTPPGGGATGPFYTIINGTVTTIGQSGARSGSDFSMNNAGTTIASNGSEIFSSTGTATITIADLTGMFSGFSAPPWINDNGTVALLASLDKGGEGVFTIGAGGITMIADNSGGISTFAAGPSINNLGEVAFIAHLRTGGDGIFTGPDLLADKVIQTGDSLFGSEVTSLSFQRPSLNDLGQVAFFATRFNGSSGIFRADPVSSVPAPSTWLLFGSGLAGLTGLAYWQRKQTA